MLQEVLDLERLPFQVRVEELEGLFLYVVLLADQHFEFEFEEVLRLLAAPYLEYIVDLVVLPVVEEAAEEFEHGLLPQNGRLLGGMLEQEQ